MRRNKAFPGPGDRVRLAIPQLDDAAPLVRYGTVVERSCGRSSALKVRWDDTAGRSGFAADGGTEGWLADAGWYWDRAQLRVVTGAEVEEVEAPVPAAARRAAPAVASGADEDAWLSTGPRAGSHDGSVDAAAEWEAALASELEVGPDGNWEDVLARALGGAAPATPVRRPAAVRPSPPPPPPAPIAAPPAPSRPAPPPVETRPTPPPAPAAVEPKPADGPPKPVQPWTGDDIIPRAGGKRRGRR